jgi:hypothetical protein
MVTIPPPMTEYRMFFMRQHSIVTANSAGSGNHCGTTPSNQTLNADSGCRGGVAKSSITERAVIGAE